MEKTALLRQLREQWSNPKRIAWLTAGLALIGGFSAVVNRPINFVPGDAYFYLVTAQNIAAGYGSTFNRIIPTNGYHPLWVLLLVPVVRLSDGGNAGLRIVALMAATLSVGVIILFYTQSWTMGIKRPYLAAPIVLGYLAGLGVLGTEAHLSALSIVLSTSILIMIEKRSKWGASLFSSLAFGSALGICMLSRLDNVFYTFSLLVMFVLYKFSSSWKSKDGHSVNILWWIVLIATSVVIVAPYLLWNVVNFGHLVPISGAIKSSFPVVVGPRLSALSWLGKIDAFLAIAVLGWVIARGPHSWRIKHVIFGGLALGTVIQSVYLVLFTRFGVSWHWYYALGTLLLAFIVADISNHIIELLQSIHGSESLSDVLLFLTAIVFVGVMAFFVWHKSVRLPPGKQVPLAQFTRVATKVPTGAPIFATDLPGSLAYWSGRPVLPLDGLISDYTYQDEIVVDGIGCYLAHYHVKYFFYNDIHFALVPEKVLKDHYDTGRVQFWSSLYQKAAGELVVQKDNELLRWQYNFGNNRSIDPIILWRIEPKCASSP